MYYYCQSLFGLPPWHVSSGRVMCDLLICYCQHYLAFTSTMTCVQPACYMWFVHMLTLFSALSTISCFQLTYHLCLKHVKCYLWAALIVQRQIINDWSYGRLHGASNNKRKVLTFNLQSVLWSTDLGLLCRHCNSPPLTRWCSRLTCPLLISL